jgi:predicted transglutaminase-like cysteine proteinase
MMAGRAAILAVAVAGALVVLAACSPKPPMKDGAATTKPSGHYSLCKNNPESIWCKK